MGSIRFRLTAVYSIVLFGLAAFVVGLIYLGLSRSLDDEPVSRRESSAAIFQTPDGQFVEGTLEREVPDELAIFEKVVNTRALEQLKTYTFGALGLLFVGSLGVGWWVAGMVLRPVGRITDVAREIQATDMSRRIGLTGPNDEMRQLADTFDDMLERLQTAFESQQLFIHEASHELRNPLATIRTNLDVALADPNTSQGELRDVGAVVARSAERMSTLVDDLLLHARHELPDDRSEVIDIAEVVTRTVEEFTLPAGERSIVIEANATSVPVCGDRSALRRALANLVANAVRLAPEGSTIQVESTASDRWALLSVTDEGPGIALDDQPSVFQRFWRGNPSDARAEGRSGLGLAIVRQIVEGHGGSVALVSEPGRGSIFTLSLPIAEDDAPVEQNGLTPSTLGS
jgi:signal transduction histidine kinase